MRRSSAMLPPKKGASKNQKKHIFSSILSVDPRVRAVPRHLEVIEQGQEPIEVIMLKVYALLDTPGSELLTVSCVDSKNDFEFEMRFDEHYPVSLRFKTQSDSERIAYAKEQIKRAGGLERLVEVFRSVFPKFSV